MITAAPAFLRFSRDKRGYEHYYLVQSTTNRRGKTRARILFWFRTPPGVKVGRLPFSDDVQRSIEAQNPGVAFDWKRLLSTPIPPPAPDVERWRERRRLEKAEKAARRALLAADGSEGEGDVGEAGSADAGDVEAGETPTSVEAPCPESAQLNVAVAVDPDAPPQAPAAPDPGVARTGRRRRRRRRGGQRDRGAGAPPANGTPPSSNPED
jgi:hypothetical protein